MIAAAVVSMVVGCSPRFWRSQADRDVYRTVALTLDDPAISVPRVDITPDPQSRFFDPHPLDCTPLPPDDPNAHQYMNAVDDWRGYNGWHRNGQSLVIENPQWYAALGLNPSGYDEQTGQYRGAGGFPELTLDEAIQLALVHGRDYQLQLENVYTAALTVTGRQFEFGVRYLTAGMNEPSVDINGTFRPGQNRVDQVNQTIDFGVRRLLPSGATFAIGLANSTMWLFAGGDATQSVPALTYSLTQPLLAAGGRKIVLEDLTQDQRTLLYELRTLARFRREYFTDVVATQAGGYLGLLQQVQTIRNQEDNIRRLKRQLDVLRAQASQKPGRPRADLLRLPPEVSVDGELRVPESVAGDLEYDDRSNELIWSRNDITDREIATLIGLSDAPAWRVAVEAIVRQLTETVVTLNVLQLESQLALSENELRSQLRRLQDSLDSYKIFLGLPTDFPLAVDDRLLQPFQFIDARITQLDRDIEAFVSEWALLDEVDPSVEESRVYLAGLRALLKRVETEGIALIQQDLDRIDDIPLDRLDEEGRLRLQTDGLRDKRLYNGVVDRIEARRAELLQVEERLNFSEQLSLTAAASSDPFESTMLAEQAAAIRRQIRDEFNEARFRLLQDAQGLAAIQIGVRADFITIEPVTFSIEEAVSIGLENRLDLKNARAQVTDAWREVERTKQLLRSNLDVTVNGTISGPNDQRPFNFRSTSNSYQFGLQFDTPLDQIDERNAYRRAQIAYQQERRTYMAAEDAIKQEIRRAWRQLFVLRRNLETAKRGVRIAALQYDVAVEQANAPASASGGGRGGVSGLDLLNALGDVLRAQNNLIGIFVDYETNRLTLARDMGTMTIGVDGIWDDPLYRRVTGGGSLFPSKTQQDSGGSGEDSPGQSDSAAEDRTGMNGQPAGNGRVQIDLLNFTPSRLKKSNQAPSFDPPLAQPTNTQ